MKSTYIFWNLVRALVVRDIRGQYRRSVLGPAWAIIRPVFMMIVFTFVHGVLNISSDGIPYPIFSFSVLVPWVFFTSAVNSCGSCIMGNASIVKKMPVAREVFPVAALVAAAFDMLMSGSVLAAMMVWYRVPVGLSLFWLPVLIGATGVLALGVGMFMAAFGTFKRDILMAGGFSLQLWLYASPIIYPMSSVPERWRDLYLLNPMVGILEGFRSVLARGESPDPILLAWALPGIVLAVLAGWPLFRKMSQYFADVL